jgi:cell division protein ZapA (FtsZ GTPase activity inhibitor)
MDTYIIKDPQFAWMVDVQNLCKTIHSKFNWGKNFEHLIEVCEDLDMRMASLTTFSKPRFADSMKNVTINVWQDYQAINKCLNDIEKILGKKEEDKKTHQETVSILRAVKNRQFTLHFLGICNLYDVFWGRSQCLPNC